MPEGLPKTIVRVTPDRFDLAAETDRLLDGLGDVGAIVSFVGRCRGEGGRLAALELEHYPEMTETEIGRIVATACERWPLAAALVIHRIGRIVPGEEIVGVVMASAHRGAAFDAAAFVMDFLKTDAPFWKKEHLADGSPSHWVEAKASDEAARRRWRKADAAE